MLLTEVRYESIPYIKELKSMLVLSDEESDIFDLAIRNKSITEISNTLMISTATVSRRLKDIRIKINRIAK